MNTHPHNVVALSDEEEVVVIDALLPPFEACVQPLKDCKQKPALGCVGIQADVFHKGHHESPVEAVAIPCIALGFVIPFGRRVRMWGGGGGGRGGPVEAVVIPCIALGFVNTLGVEDRKWAGMRVPGRGGENGVDRGSPWCRISAVLPWEIEEQPLEHIACEILYCLQYAVNHASNCYCVQYAANHALTGSQPLIRRK